MKARRDENFGIGDREDADPDYDLKLQQALAAGLIPLYPYCHWCGTRFPTSRLTNDCGRCAEATS